MDTEKRANGELQAEKKRVFKKRFLRLYLPLGILILVLILVLMLPAVLSSGFAQNWILQKVNTSISGKADVSDISIGWFGGVKVQNIKFEDNLGKTFVDVKSVSTKPAYFSLLAGKISLSDTVVEQPNVRIDLTEQKPAATTQRSGQKTVPLEKGQASKFELRKIELKVNNGKLSVRNGLNCVQCSEIDSGLNFNASKRDARFAVDMKIGQQSDFTALGDISSDSKKWKMNNLTGNIDVEVNNLDLEKIAPLLALANMELEAEGQVDADIKSELKKGKIKTLNARINAAALYLKPAVLKGDYISSEKVGIVADVVGSDEYLNINKFTFSSDWVNADITGRLPEIKKLDKLLDYKSELNLNAKYQCDIAELASRFSNTLKLEGNIKVLSGELSGITNTVSRDGKRVMDSENILKEVSAVKDGKEIVLDEPLSFNAEIESSPEGVNYKKVNFKSSFAKLLCSGTNERLNYEFFADADNFQRQLGEFVNFGDYEFKGNFIEKGMLEISDEKISFSGRCDYDNIGLVSPYNVSDKEGSITHRMFIELGTSEPVVTVEKFDIETTFADIGVAEELNIDLIQPGENINAVVDIKRLGLSETQQTFANVFTVPNNVGFSGTLTGKTKVDYQNQTLRVKPEPVVIEDFKVVSAGKKPFTQESVLLNADIKLDLGQKTFSADWKLVSPQIKLNGEITNEKITDDTKKIQGKADYQFDWQTVSSAVSQFIPDKLEVKGVADDTVEFSSIYSESKSGSFLANMNARTSLDFNSANFMGLNFKQTAIPCRFENGIMEISKFSSSVNNGKLNFAAKADFNQKPALLEVLEPMKIADNVGINQQTTKSLLMYINPLFADAVSAEGMVNFQSRKLIIPMDSANKELLHIDGNIGIDAQLNDSGLLSKILTVTGSSGRTGNIKIYPTDFILTDSVLSYNDMQVDAGSQPIFFDGRIGLDKSLDMKVKVPVNGSSNMLIFPLKGTLNNPQIDIQGLLQQQLEKQIKKGIEEGLKDLFK